AVPILDWLKDRGRLAVAVALVLLLLPLAQSARLVFSPWERPDTGSAVNWVLEHRQQDDVVLGNDWTHSYYFRCLGSRFHEQPAGDERSARRAWVVYTAKLSEGERLRQAQGWLGGGWQAWGHREFELTTGLFWVRPHPE